jgi:Domain of unknown function (DUF5916)/Carbohydrate family 9 binding domain-like
VSPSRFQSYAISCLLLVLVLVCPARAQAPPPPSAVVSGVGSPTVTIPRIDAAAQIDGVLDEPAWSQAARLGHFSQYQPADGRPAEEETEVLVWYSPTAIYFGIVARDSDPSSVRATMSDRDNLDAEDTVTIYLDTFHDLRRAFFFTVNALGAQQDGMHSEAGFNAGTLSGGGMDDKTPDFQFDSKGRLTDFGYVVELRIPFKTLRYPGGAAPQTWGLQVRRIVQRTQYKDTWTDARRAGESFLAQSGAIAGLHDMRRGIVTETQPVLVVSENGSRASAGAPFVRGRPDFKPGLNFRFSTTSLTVDTTVNPDFSQIEADAAQVTANQRFALFYPEKRPFFLEGIDMFATPNQLVYTRQIVDPIAGAKLTGKLGSWNVAYLGMKEREGSGGALFDIARVRRDIGSGSTFGVTFTDRSADSGGNRVVAVDQRTIFKEIWYYQVQAAGSWTDFPDGSRRSSPMWMAELDATGRAFGINYKLTGIGTDFQADSGYVPRNDIVQGNLYNRYSWYGAKGARFETFSAHYNASRIWRYHDFGSRGPIEGADSFVFQFGWRGGWSLNANLQRVFWDFQRDSYVAYQLSRTGEPYLPIDRVGGFTPDVSIRTPVFRSFDAQVDVSRGPVAIFAEGSAGHQTAVSATVNARPTRSLRLQATLTRSRIERDRDGSEFALTVIPRFKVEYQPTRAIFFRMVGQYQSQRQGLLLDAIGGEPLTVAGVIPPAQKSDGLRLDWLASYKPTPGTMVFFGYGASFVTDRTLSLANLERMSDGFFLKVAYLFRR